MAAAAYSEQSAPNRQAGGNNGESKRFTGDQPDEQTPGATATRVLPPLLGKIGIRRPGRAAG